MFFYPEDQALHLQRQNAKLHLEDISEDSDASASQSLSGEMDATQIIQNIPDSISFSSSESEEEDDIISV